MAFNRDDLFKLPERHPRYDKQPPDTHITDLTMVKVEPELRDIITQAERRKKKPLKPHTRRLWLKFYELFETTHGYKYPGNFGRETAALDRFQTNEYDADFLEEVIDFLFNDENRGIWWGQAVSIDTICFGKSHHAIIETIQKKRKETQAPTQTDGWGQLGRLDW